MAITRENTEKWFMLSKANLKNLYAFYIILLVLGIIVTIVALQYESLLTCLNISQISLFGGVGTALLGSTIFYLRKLYKSSINKLMNKPKDEDEEIRELGILFYYYLRPVFAICFSVLFHLALKSSISIISVSEVILDSGMIYLTMMVSFFLGFASGDVITKIEAYSKEVVERTIQNF